MWTTTDEVVAELGSGPFSPADRDTIDRAVIATNELVTRWRPDLTPGLSEPVCLGATRLAAALYRRRGATGQEWAEFSDLGSGTLAPGIIDADIQALLGIGRHHKPVIA